MKGRIKRIYRLARAFFPRALAQTPAEHYKWATELLELNKLPENDSFRQALATMVMHLGPTTGYKSDYFFSVSLKKSIANQVAYNQISEIREREKEAKEATTVVEAQVVS